MRKLLLFIFLLMFTNVICAQINMPKVVPPSPEAVALFRYNEIPLDYTGIPQQSIPIYTIQAGPLSLPISLNYHSGGRRVDDKTGPVGLGWNLNAGGMVTRTIFGYPDETRSFLHSMKTASEISDMNNLDKYEYLTRIKNTYSGYDTEYDIYSYMIPGYSGNYIIRDNSDVIPISEDPVDIKAKRGSAPTIKDDKGVIYNFTAMSSAGGGTVEWALTSMKSPDNKHEIKLKYNKDIQTDKTDIHNTSSTFNSKLIYKDGKKYSLRQEIGGGYVNGEPTNVWGSVESGRDESDIIYGCWRITEIDFGTGKVLFDVESIGAKIKQIDVTNHLGDTVKTVKLYYGDYIDRIEFLKTYVLRNISFVTNDIGKNEKDIAGDTYQFDYYPSFDSRSSNYDHWGFKNSGKSYVSDKDMFPSRNIHLAIYDVYAGMGQATKTAELGQRSAARESSLEGTQAGIIREITYPTGGKTEFIYELNEIYALNERMKGAGLRVKQMKTVSEDGKTMTKTYGYGLGGLNMIYNYQFWGHESITINTLKKYPYHNPSHDDLTYFERGFTRYRIFNSKPPKELSFMANENVRYSFIKEYIGEEGNNIGKIDYEYSVSPKIGISYFPTPSSSPSLDWGFMCGFAGDIHSLWKKDNLKTKKEYKYDSIKQDYILQKEVRYEYKSEPKDTIRGMKIYKYMNFASEDSEKYYAIKEGYSVYSYTDYYIKTGKEYLSKVTETEYRDEKEITTIATNTYNSKYLPKETALENSSGKEIKEQIQYPFEVKSTINDQMVELNMLNYPIKQTKKTDAGEEKTMTEYKDFGTNLIKPYKVFTQRNEEKAELRLQYHNYDPYGNPLYISKDDIDKAVYLWGYKGQYPVAEIKNASYDDVKKALGSVIPDSLSSAIHFDSVRVEGLRTNPHLISSYVTSFYYKPLIGLNKIIDPTGQRAFYNYDNFGRLQSVKNNDNQILAKYEYNYHVEPLYATLNCNSAIYVGEEGIFSIYLKGGSGNFTYNWYLKDESGYLITSKTDGEKEFRYEFTSSVGNKIITCEIYDKARGTTEILSRTFKLDYPLIEFRNVRYTEDGLTAELYSGQSTTVTLELGLEQKQYYWGSTVKGTIGSNSFERPYNGTETRTVTLSNYPVKVTMSVKNGDTSSFPSSNRVEGWLKITRVSVGGMGYYSRISLSK